MIQKSSNFQLRGDKERTGGGGIDAQRIDDVIGGKFWEKKGFSVLFCSVLNLEAHSLIVQDHYSVA